MDVGVEMDQFAESLDAGNHAGFCVAAAEHLPIDLHSGLPGGASQFAKQTAVVAAVDPQPFGDGEDELPVGDGSADRLGDRFSRQQGALLMAAWTKASLLTGEGYEHLVAAV